MDPLDAFGLGRKQMVINAAELRSKALEKIGDELSTNISKLDLFSENVINNENDPGEIVNKCMDGVKLVSIQFFIKPDDWYEPELIINQLRWSNVKFKDCFIKVFHHLEKLARRIIIVLPMETRNNLAKEDDLSIIYQEQHYLCFDDIVSTFGLLGLNRFAKNNNNDQAIISDEWLKKLIVDLRLEGYLWRIYLTSDFGVDCPFGIFQYDSVLKGGKITKRLSARI